MPKQLDNKEKSGNNKLPMSMVKKAALGFIGLAGVVTGFNILGNADNPPRNVPHITTLDSSSFGVSGPVQHPKAGEGLFYEGKKVSWLEEIAKFTDGEGGHMRDSLVVESDNDVRFVGLQKDEALYLANPVISPDAETNPNGTALVTTADSHNNFVFDKQARDEGALKTVKSNIGDDGATNINSGIIKEVYANGMKVQKYDEFGREVGDLVAVGVIKIGDENLQP